MESIVGFGMMNKENGLFNYTFLSAEGNPESEEKEELQSTGEDEHFGPKCYYDKAKSFFDNISSDMKFR